MSTWFRWLLVVVQTLVGLRVAWRLLRTGGDTPIGVVPEGKLEPGVVSVIMPVLNEAHRLSPCVQGLQAQGPEVGEVLVVDSGSRDAT